MLWMKKEVKKLFNIPSENLGKAIEKIPWCKICNKNNIYLSAAIKCQHCNHLNHKKCSKTVKNTKSACQECFFGGISFQLTLMNF